MTLENSGGSRSLSGVLEKDPSQPSPLKSISVYSYNDYRLFLADSLKNYQRKNLGYSATAFCRQAGFGQNSRGYFGLIIRGKRNLGAKGVKGFAKALKLSERESLYFENLVAYNQAQTETEKREAYFRLSKTVRSPSKAYEILSSQYRYLSSWYYVAIRELVGLKDFSPEVGWITQKLKKKVTKKQVKEALEDLKALEVIKEERGRLVQVDKIVRFTDSNANYTVVNNIHRELLDLAKESLNMDSHENRSISSIVIGTKRENFAKIRKEIANFRKEIINKYCTELNETDVVLSMGIQLLFLSQHGMESLKKYSDSLEDA